MRFRRNRTLCCLSFTVILIFLLIDITGKLNTLTTGTDFQINDDNTIDGTYMQKFKQLEFTLNKHLYADTDLFQAVLNKMKKEGKVKNTDCKKDSIQNDSIFKPVDIRHGAALFDHSQFKAEKYLSEVPIIPHIIHQLWDSRQIPGLLKPWIRSIVKHHPYWEYWFWTLQDVECLIKMNYPGQLSMFQSYRDIGFKAAASRYFILHTYGGIFMDPDTEVLKPMDFWTYHYPAVISYETYEHSYLAKKRKQPNLMYGVIASKPRHPFLTMLTNGLEQYSRVRDVEQAAGWTYLQYKYEFYLRSEMHRAEKNLVMTIHPKYWYPKWDPALHHFSTACSNGIQLGTLSEHALEICNNLDENDYMYEVTHDAFLNYHWMHVYSWDDRKKRLSTFDVAEVVPHVKLVSNFIDCIGDN